VQKHTKIYLAYFDYGEEDFIPCEICSSKSVDIHHIDGRGKGKDVIENLMALCRECHNMAHRKNIKDYLQNEHIKFIRWNRGK
jgi:5-methylcytosine-specific restriction endonuclease McrA